MAEQKGIALVILGIVAIIAIIGLVLLFRGGGVTGANLADTCSIEWCGDQCLPACSHDIKACLACSNACQKAQDIRCF